MYMMNFTDIATIRREFVQPYNVALTDEQLLQAFGIVASTFGDDWLLRLRVGRTDAFLPLDVTEIGHFLRLIKGLPRSAGLISKLRNHDRSALAELRSLCLFLDTSTTLEFELEPHVVVGTRDRKCDFRVRCPGDSEWTNIEVTRPLPANEHEQRNGVLEELASGVQIQALTANVDVAIKRKPTLEELQVIIDAISICGLRPDRGEEELQGGLGTVAWTTDESSSRSGPGLLVNIVSSDNRRVCIRIAYNDSRLSEFLRREASQLPDTGAGIIVIEAQNVVGSRSSWPPAIAVELGDGNFPNVSAVVLFVLFVSVVDGALSKEPHVLMIENSMAVHPIPPYIRQVLGEHKVW